MSEPTTITGSWNFNVPGEDQRRSLVVLQRGMVKLITIRVSHGTVTAHFVVPGFQSDAFSAPIAAGASLTILANHAAVALADGAGMAYGTYEVVL